MLAVWRPLDPTKTPMGGLPFLKAFRLSSDAAITLIVELVQAYDAVETPGDTVVNFPNGRDAPTQMIRLAPREGAPADLRLPRPGRAPRGRSRCQ
jgi:hypothetical protein